MRDILDKLNQLLESTGLANRKPGDIFKNKEGDQMSFNKIEFYPRNGGKFDSEQLNSAVQKLGADIQWQNSPNKSGGGIALVTFDTDKGPIQYGFFRKEIFPNKLDNKIKNDSIPGFNFKGKAAEKVQSGLTPQDLLTKKDNLTQEEIIEQLIKKLGEDNPLVQVAIRVSRNEKYPIKFPAPEGISYTGFRDYFCEILQPMALQNGQYEGNAGEAAETFLDGSFAGTLISFDAAKNAGLSDSILSTQDGKYVKISTKGGKGAQASVKALADSLNELQVSPIGKKLLDTYGETVEIINQILARGQVGAPLYLGVKFDIISEEEVKQIMNLRKLPPVDLKNIDQLELSDNLKKLAKERDTDMPESVNLFYHLIASVAHLAAKEVNNKTDFSKAATDILNNGALVQVYTDSSESKNEWSLNKFETVYPSKSIKGVYLSAGKNYFSTQIKGNYTFVIDKTGKKPKEENSEPETTQATTSISNKQFTKTAKELERGLRQPFKKKETTGVGRKKQSPK
jgi:hypothetical protein